MTDWEDIGERIFLRWAKDSGIAPDVPDIPFPKKPPPTDPETRNLADLEAYNEELNTYREHLEAEGRAIPGTRLQWALRLHVDGVSSKPLIECLRSDEQLSAADRECLAAFFEGGLRRRPGRNNDARVKHTATLARTLYRDWKLANLEAGISDWGVGDSMKDKSCEYAIELEGLRKPGEAIAFDAVRLMMDRPISRRNPR